MPETEPRAITWYRTPMDSKTFKALHQKSDFLGWCQTLGYLGLLVFSSGTALYSVGRWPVGVVLLLVLLHGTFCAFLINAVHELGHNTVFKTKALNSFFVRVFSFFGWINFEMFNTSHTRHHRYTLHQPDDLEVTLPAKIILRQAMVYGIINARGIFGPMKSAYRVARPQFQGEWELRLFPEGSPERKAAVNWARTLLVGHGLIILFSIGTHLWLLPILTTFNGFYGGWLQSLCNNTQHIGMQDDVPDFRLCCRTFTLNPFLQFLYWHMNYHIEHHMFAAVPCYRLGALHRAIKYDLPPCPDGLVKTWKEINAIQKIQETNPDYQYVAPLPNPYRPELAASPA
jgi:fatty acid desaturase